MDLTNNINKKKLSNIIMSKIRNDLFNICFLNNLSLEVANDLVNKIDNIIYIKINKKKKEMM